jgi:ubiquinone/menaquinone biosynthesis C-methylase UbiE
MNSVIDFYEQFDEENRLIMDNARKVEFITTTTILNQYMEPHYKILELGAGTGAYSFYYAERGNDVVATDLVPKHVEIINQKLKEKNNGMRLSAEIVNATELNQYKSNSFDVVTCLGPMYHLTDEFDRIKCINEALRVLKPGGILAIAYINKHYIIHGVMANQKKFLTKNFIANILSSGVNQEGDKGCFFTVGFFTTPDEIEAFIKKFNVEIIDHAATDGICALLRNQINELESEQYEAWLNYHFMSCRERNMLGISNHGILLCRKK